MYGYGAELEKDNRVFNASIEEMDKDRDCHYSSKLDVANDLDNIYGDQHQICAESGFGHISEEELRKGQKGKTIECHVLNLNKRKFYAMSWEEISEAAEEDDFLVKLKLAMMSDNTKEMAEGQKHTLLRK